MPLHSKFYEIGQKKLYKNIHLNSKYHIMIPPSSDLDGSEYKGKGNRWRAHKNILNDFTKKYTIISLCSFYTNMIEKKMNRYQHIHHLSIEDIDHSNYARHLNFWDRKGVPEIFRKTFEYFENIHYVSFAISNNQFEKINKDNFHDVINGIDFNISILPEFYDYVLFLEKDDHGSFDFLYNNLKSLKFEFRPIHNFVKKYSCEKDLFKSIKLFNKINLFKNLEELHLGFEVLIDLTDPVLIEKLNKINCKLKKLDLLFWGKIKFVEDIYLEKQTSSIKPKPKKWLFTLDNFFDTKEITSLALNIFNKMFDKEYFIYEKFEFKEILINANLSKLRNLVLSSQFLDLKSIDVSKLHKLIICTDVANDNFVNEIAKLYFKNPTLRLSWWPRFMNSHAFNIFAKTDNIQLSTPDYFQIISCQWPSYFFRSNIISIENEEYTSQNQSLIDDKQNSKSLDILLKNNYSIQELVGMDLFVITCIDESVLKVLKRYEPTW
ncbi:uncharacterized protein KGF55_000114 [Candida pseudojiufengensis]|uniref:uncharacterized protein n=1 Tax=Candida pseudojiufengensis TaxID=497109 RepID=UPI002225283D|nr:uncharacterized protein KGF55_000114 [Candida pseudojiufengensis]KAI5966705.1 hypothetical protein KGF55_000114 [Candida pseudojiufengensis]